MLQRQLCLSMALIMATYMVETDSFGFLGGQRERQLDEKHPEKKNGDTLNWFDKSHNKKKHTKGLIFPSKFLFLTGP